MNRKEMATFISQKEIEIKLIIQYGLRNFISKSTMLVQAKQVINDATNVIKDLGKEYEELALKTRKGLQLLFSKTYRMAMSKMPALPIQALKIPKKLFTEAKDSKDANCITLIDNEPKNMIVDAKELKKYMTLGASGYSQMLIDDYTDKVNHASTYIAENRATLKASNGHRLSVRNLAEMTVRYEENKEHMQGLKDDGVKLVIVSQHNNASDRCRPWQGRVYSLDGTSGTTKDSNRRSYTPLQEAIDAGLFGYNCRHRAVKYIPNMHIPKAIPEKTILRERAIESKQRYYERSIRHLKEMEILEKDKELRKGWNEKYEEQFSKYKAYCRSNNKAFYPARCEVILNRSEIIETLTK